MALQRSESKMGKSKMGLKVAFLSKFMFNYVVLVVSGYWTRCPDTGQFEVCKNINFTTDTTVKNLNLFSSYYRLNRLSLGQISELLRLRKGSYNISKLKCPDTGQRTVSINHELYEKVVGFFIYRTLSKTTNCMKSRNLYIITDFNKLVQQIIPENDNFGLCAFSSNLKGLAVLTHCCHGN